MRPTSRATHRVLWSIALAGLLVLVAWKALTPSAAVGGAVSALVQAPGPSPALETLTLYPDADTFVD